MCHPSAAELGHLPAGFTKKNGFKLPPNLCRHRFVTTVLVLIMLRGQKSARILRTPVLVEDINGSLDEVLA